MKRCHYNKGNLRGTVFLSNSIDAPPAQQRRHFNHHPDETANLRSIFWRRLQRFGVHSGKHRMPASAAIVLP